MKTKLKIADLLRGCETGRLQSAGAMQVLPLLSDLRDDRFVSAAGQARVSTSDYGTLVFENGTDRTMIVPSNAAYVIKEAAQDHAIPGAGTVPRNSRTKITDAMCVQQSQGGLIRGQAYRLRILPFALRERAMRLQGKGEYSKLWGAIDGFNKSYQVPGGANLTVFFRSFAKQLEEFTAEFETVPRQVGALVLVDGDVVGLERAPSPEFWRTVWQPLIRDCYGSLALAARNAGNAGNAGRPYRVPLDGAGVGCLADIADKLRAAEARQAELARRTVRELLGEGFGFRPAAGLNRALRKSGAEFELGTAENGQFVGQVLRDGEAVSYASLVAKKAWRGPIRSAWRRAKEFVI